MLSARQWRSDQTSPDRPTFPKWQKKNNGKSVLQSFVSFPSREKMLELANLGASEHASPSSFLWLSSPWLLFGNTRK